MTFLVTEKCICCKYTNCVEVCPTECFHEGSNFLVINPNSCIDCSLCEAECPIEAIISDNNITNNEIKFLKLNEQLSRVWPVIKNKKSTQIDSKRWENVKNKLKYLKT